MAEKKKRQRRRGETLRLEALGPLTPVMLAIADPDSQASARVMGGCRAVAARAARVARPATQAAIVRITCLGTGPDDALCNADITPEAFLSGSLICQSAGGGTSDLATVDVTLRPWRLPGGVGAVASLSFNAEVAYIDESYEWRAAVTRTGVTPEAAALAAAGELYAPLRVHADANLYDMIADVVLYEGPDCDGVRAVMAAANVAREIT